MPVSKMRRRCIKMNGCRAPNECVKRPNPCSPNAYRSRRCRVLLSVAGWEASACPQRTGWQGWGWWSWKMKLQRSSSNGDGTVVVAGLLHVNRSSNPKTRDRVSSKLKVG
jgi:hypothetical protein